MDWSLLGFGGLNQVLNIHPVFVHFPIALYPTALLFYGIGLFRKRYGLLLAGQICLALGLAGTLLSVLTGYWAQESIPHGEAVHRIMGTHQNIGFAILALGVLLMIWSFLKREGIPKGSKSFMILMGFTVLLIMQNADLGGRMVFVEGAAVKAMQTQTKEEAPDDHGEAVPEKKPDANDHQGHDHQH